MNEPQRPLMTDIKSDDRIIDLGYLFPVLIRWSWVVVLAMTITTAKGLWDMHRFQPQSIATMLVAPLQQAQSISAPGLTGGISNALAGLGLARVTRTATVFDRLVHSTSTITLARRLEDKYKLLEIIYPGSWDAIASNWIQPTDPSLARNEAARRFFNLGTWSPPDLEDLASYISSNFVVKGVENAPLTEISFSHQNPDLALKFLEIVYDEAELLLRTEDRLEALQRRNFLENRLRETNQVELRSALAALLAGEARREMVVHKELPFAARVVEPPYISKFKTSPNKTKLLFVPVIFSMMGALVAIVLIALFRSE